MHVVITSSSHRFNDVRQAVTTTSTKCMLQPCGLPWTHESPPTQWRPFSLSQSSSKVHCSTSTRKPSSYPSCDRARPGTASSRTLRPCNKHCTSGPSPARRRGSAPAGTPRVTTTEGARPVLNPLLVEKFRELLLRLGRYVQPPAPRRLLLHAALDGRASPDCEPAPGPRVSAGVQSSAAHRGTVDLGVVPEAVPH